jgi:hypothetical protein
MKTVFAAFVLVLGLLSAGAAKAAEACVLYEHAGFGGQALFVPPNGSVARFGAFNDRLSSVHVPPGCRLTIHEHVDFRGAALSFSGDVGFVGDRWNDQASSASCACQVVHQQPRGCTMYQHAGFRGRAFDLRAGERVPFVGHDWNDQASSARVDRGCRLTMFEHADYQGASLSLRRDAEYFGHDWNDQVSSAMCSCR